MIVETPKGSAEPRPKVRIICPRCPYHATGEHGSATMDAFADHMQAVHGGQA